ncbi:MAG TPA: NAD-dependent epimerase/dehydratase family protein [Actinomycetota bacterium]|nr:NAD-dependent epimerase/dehydratase family protein [Actinomycetota bacterium]
MKILTIGGTRFFGRAFVEEAAGRGHEVSVFHRGESEPGDLPEVVHLHGDRKAGLEILAERSWDAVLDTCAFVPREVRELAQAIGDRVGHYTLVSSLSVHPEDLPVGATEDTPPHQPPYPDTEAVTDETYGPLKVACEVEAAEVFAERLLVIRPGYIVGPHDPTDRFTYWVRRAAGGGEMLAAGPPDASIQGIDARDLGTFVLDRIEASDTDTYGVVGPAEPTTTAGVLESARLAGGADTTFVWADQEFVRGLGGQYETWFPMWHPHLPGFHAYDAGKATAAGLRPRPFDETVADTLAWDRQRGLPPLGAGMTSDKERELLSRWRAQG